MRTRWRTLLACILIISMPLAIVGCKVAGDTARDLTGTPALQLGDDIITKHARIAASLLPPGAAHDTELAQIEQFESIIAEGNRDRIATEGFMLWSAVQSAALAGIEFRLNASPELLTEHGTTKIGPGVAESLRTTVMQFNLTITNYALRN